MTAIAPPKLLRASHRKVLQLFRLYGSQTDQELYEAAKAEGWDISPSGLRSRRSELSPPRGGGLKDSGQRARTVFGKEGRFSRRAIVWMLDPEVSEPYAGRS